MGNLHAGHIKLVRHAKAIASRVVVSIFVNPMQFGAGEDYESYPLTMGLDKEALMDVDADLLFVPSVREIYPHGNKKTTRVEVPGLNSILCGEHRPSHFNGVTTVVARLFNIVQPDLAVFGEKDYQQLVIIRRMVEDLCMSIAIKGIETVREPDGLAMSSRNNYLDKAERAQAPMLYRVLCDVQQQVEAGEQDFSVIETSARERLHAAGFKPDYISIRRQSDLAEPTVGDNSLIVLAAAQLGPTRLIDNVKISTV